VPRLRYRFPLGWLMEMGRDMLLARPRSFRDDCALAARELPRPPLVDGLEQVPRDGSFILVANHYQRRDLWIGWVGGLLCDSLWRVRPELACHIITTDCAVVGGASVCWTRWLFERAARVWDLILVTPPEACDADAALSRHHALRASLRRLHRPDGRPVCLLTFPEGINGSTRGLLPAAAGSGRSLLALAASGAPILPVGVWEERTGALHARFGPVWRPVPKEVVAASQVDARMRDEVMRRIAALLPDTLRGAPAQNSVAEVE
jgi:1-acyl-sn-glycerol-3-phosphate acyltransferase